MGINENSSFGLQQLQPNIDPKEEPLTYPGAQPASSGLLIDDFYYPLTSTENRRLGQWTVDVSLDQGVAKTHCRRLDYVLLCLNQASSGRRYPVLAIGSNSSPRQIVNKLTVEGPSPTVVPMTKGTVRGISLAVSAHVSPPGYIPFTPVIDPTRRESKHFVAWLTKAQLARLDETEPNYTRVFIDGTQIEIKLQSEETLGACYAYVSNRGYILNESGKPLTPDDTQARILENLFNRSSRLSMEFGNDFDAVTRRWASSENDRELVATILQEDGLVEKDREVKGRERIWRPYEEIPPLSPLGASGYRVAATPAEQFDRHGQASIRLPSTHTSTSAPRLELVTVRPANRSLPINPSVVARVSGRSADGNDVIEMDQIIRNAIGVEVGEYVEINQATLKRNKWTDWIVGEFTYMTCRVQSADLTAVEIEICLLDELTMDVLGIQSGDEIVVEGIPVEGAGKEIPRIKVKAFRSDSVHERRENLHGGGAEARFPSSLDALGVFPDLPWIFLDEASRTALGLTGKLGTVRIRPSHSYQAQKELREMLLLLAIAFLGVVTIINNSLQRSCTLAALVIIASVVVAIRMRGRLTRRVRPLKGKTQ